MAWRKENEAVRRTHEAVGRVIARTERDIVRAHSELIRRVVERLPLLNMGVVKGDGVEWASLREHPRFRKALRAEVERMRVAWRDAMGVGIERGWWMGEEEADALVHRFFRGRGVPRGLERSYLVRTEEAREAFRRERMDFISRRVWQEGERVGRHLEDSISEALSEGMSAGDLSRKIREDLRYPDKLFRRVRDKYGELVLSRRARAFHPGRGVSRSSARNAMRLARTEINSAYRTADHERWQGMDFVKGIRISLSNNHTCNGVPFTDICDDLAGVYPKDFKFTGWHPQCRCVVTTILEDFDDFLKRKAEGGEAPEGVVELPDNFKQWAGANADRIERAEGRGTLPFFLRDNFKVEGGGRLERLVSAKAEKKPTALEVAKARHEARTPEEVQAIRRRWNDRREKRGGVINYEKRNETLDEYLSGNGMWINQYLRDPNSLGWISDEDRKYLQELTDLTTHETIKDKRLWRSVDASSIFGKITDGEYDDLIGHYLYGGNNRFVMQTVEKFGLKGVVDKTFVEKGFMSTTRSKEIAVNWRGFTGSRRPIVLNINTAKGTRGVDIERYTKIHHPEIEARSPQREVLLARGQRYKVTNIRGEQDALIVDVELIADNTAREIAGKLAEGLQPYQSSVYASFEPFSPAIMESVRKAKDRKAKNAIFESVLNDTSATTLHTTKDAKTTLFPNHKGRKSKYWAETKEMAKALNERGISVSFLPEMDETSSADALLKLGNQKWAIADFKYSGTTNSNTLAKQLLKGFRQSEGCCVLKMGEGDLGTFREAIEECKRKGYVRGMFVINKYDKVVSVSSSELLSGKYERKLKGFF